MQASTGRILTTHPQHSSSTPILNTHVGSLPRHAT